MSSLQIADDHGRAATPRKTAMINVRKMNMAGLRWVTPIAMAIAIAESEWKSELEKASALFN